jgi:hypothetical protein
MKNRISILATMLLLACYAQVQLACSSAGTSAAHSFDKQAYDTLLVAQAAIEQAKVEGHDASPNIVHAINAVIGHYNEAYKAYVAFHASVNIVTNTNSENLKQQLIALLGEIAQIRQMMSHTGAPEGGGA